MKNLLYCIAFLLFNSLCFASQDTEANLCREIAKTLNYPYDKIQLTNSTTLANKEIKSGILLALELRGVGNTFARMDLIISKRGLLFTPELEEWCDKKSKDPNSTIKSFTLKNDVLCYSGLGMGGPGGSAENIYAKWAERGMDMIIAVGIPREGLDANESTKAYHALVMGDAPALSAKLIEIMGHLIDHAVNDDIRFAGESKGPDAGAKLLMDNPPSSAQKSASATEPPPSMQWLVVAGMIVAPLGLLWLWLKKRR